MKRYRLIKRGLRGGRFYVVDNQTRKRASLGTNNPGEAERIIHAKNEATRQPFINLQIAKAYLAGVDGKLITRTWEEVFDTIISIKQGSTQTRWKVAKNDNAFAHIMQKRLIETKAEDFIEVMKVNKVSTTLHLRKVHNFALDMDWLPKSVIPKRRWPKIVYKPKRAITEEEHASIVSNEKNHEWKAFYRLLWHTGGSQTDIARLQAHKINWNDKTISFQRAKTGSVVLFRFAKNVEEILQDLPGEDLLFPNLAKMHEKDRAKQFIRRCNSIGIKGVSLHSYRYAWAERARKAGYPERFAQEALGHNSPAIHRAYAKNAQVKVPSLEEYAQTQREENK